MINKKFYAFTIAFVLMLQSASVFATPVKDLDSIVYDANEIIGIALEEGIVPGQKNGSIEELYLAECIPIYEVTSDNTLTGIELLKYYPVLNQDNVVCGVIIARVQTPDDDAAVLEYSPMFSDELSSYAQSSTSICFIFDQTNIFIYDGVKCSPILQNNIPDLDRGFLELTDVGGEEVVLSKIRANKALSPIETLDPAMSGFLSVPIIEQTGWTNGCWAATSISVGEYCGSSQGLTVDDVMNEYAGGEDVAKTMFTIRKVLSDEYGVGTYIHPGLTPKLSSIIESIGSGTDNGTPILARVAYNSIFSGHFIVVCGYTAAPDPQTSYVTIMDSLVDSYRILEMERVGNDCEIKYNNVGDHQYYDIDDYLTMA